MELNKVIQEQTDKLIAEKLPEMVTEKVGKLIDNILEDVFRRYSDTGKKIKEEIEKSINVSLVEFKLQDYNVMISKAIAGELEKQIDIKPIEGLVGEIVGRSPKKQITVSAIAEKITELSMDDTEEYEPEGGFSFHVEENEKHSWTEISIDLEEDKSASDCELKMLISNRSGTIFSLRKNDYFNSDQEFSGVNMVGMSSLETYVFGLYANRVTITVDDDYVETSWNRNY